MNILVLAEAYPSASNLYAMGFVHSRSLEYLSLGHDVTVLSFQATRGYEFEGVRVCTAIEAEAWCRQPGRFDVIFSHAPNVRHHLQLLRKVSQLPVVFFLHGHEVLRTQEHYPVPFAFDRGVRERLGRLARAAYDPIKLWAFRRFCQQRLARNQPLGLVFVSEWMRQAALGVSPWLAGAANLPWRIIPNAVNGVFLRQHYTPAAVPDADLVCIRPFDNPKYAVDEVVAWARACPELTFHVYGKGRYFDFHPAPANMTVFPRFVPQAEIPSLLNRYRACALPTRLDSQGVMGCEMATYGIPMFTTDLEVTQQMLGRFDNVRRVPLGSRDLSVLRQVPAPLPQDAPVRRTFSGPMLASQELRFGQELVGQSQEKA